MFKRIFRVSECVNAGIYTKRPEEKSTVMIIFRVSECVDACIYTKRAREKSTKLTKFASCVLGHPKCFRHPKTTYWYPPLQSRVDMMFFRANTFANERDIQSFFWIYQSECSKYSRFTSNTFALYTSFMLRIII